MFPPRLSLFVPIIAMNASLHFTAAAAATVPESDASLARYDWIHVGPGGGGNFWGQGISPHDANLLFTSNDMGANFRSADAGKTWTMIPHDQLTYLAGSRIRQSTRQRAWAFDPFNSRRIFAGNSDRKIMLRSDDAGVSWTELAGPWREKNHARTHSTAPRLVTFSFLRRGLALAGFNPASNSSDNSKNGNGNTGPKIYQTTDAGDTWTFLSDLPANSGDLVALNFSASPANRVVAATANGIFRSDDGGRSWSPATDGLPAPAAFAKTTTTSGTAPSFADGKLHPYDMSCSEKSATFYLTLPVAFDPDGNLAGGLYRSTDGGSTWQAAGQTGLFVDANRPVQFEQVATSEADATRVYLTMRGVASDDPKSDGISTLYRSNDGGRSWTPTLRQHPEQKGFNITNTSWNTLAWGWQIRASGIAVAPQNPDVALVGTMTAVFRTDNGGRDWRQIHAPDGTITAQPGGGLQMLSVWNYYFDPHNYDRRFLASTDFSGWRATEDGTLWSYNITGNPWHNNSYALALDPAIKDKLWAAASVTHDIPTWKYQKNLGNYKGGGVVLSTDGGKTWTARDINHGLPNQSATDIWLDPRSPANVRRLWLAVPGHGAYFSNDDGRHWEKRNNGILPENLNVLRITGTPDGSRLYALTTIRHSPRGILPGALYVSDDNGLNWRQLWRRPGVVFLNRLTVDPHNPQTLYLSALQKVSGADATDGGVWRSTNGGQSWEPVFPHPAWAVSADPRNPGHLYASSWARRGDGLHFSSDNGNTWRRLAGYPFWRPMNVAFDPRRADRIYVTNFGAGIICGVIKNQ
ncbi:MAG: hypothetical protein LBK99_16145 [Opitutaceae bacterium]|jgi:photosystem II stability/assembly factor-like uncharacterized protein|nr:hypothetical protein [Opitutaceae bacterium]